MSLILEALKKSEARRQLGAAPSLGTPFTTTRRRRSAWPLVVIVLGVAAVLGWMYLRPHPQQPTAATAAGAPAKAVRSGTQSAPGPAANTIAAQPAPNAAASAPHAPGAFNPAFVTAAKNPQRSNAAQRVMPANVPQPLQVPDAAQNPHFPQMQRARTPEGAAPINVAERHAEAHPAGPAAMHEARPAAPPPPTAPPAVPAPVPAQPAAARPAATAASAQAAAAHPNLPLYYELPYDVRKDLPALDMTMHVYAADAGQRFVVIDGERATEGATIKESVTLRQIRPDGVVLEFHGHEFFYPRPGA